MKRKPFQCAQADLWISVRVDGESLPDETAECLDEHLAVCERCREVLAREEERAALLEEVLSSEGGEVAREVARSVAREASELQGARGVRETRWRSTRLAASLVLAILAGFAVAWTLPELWRENPPVAEVPGAPTGSDSVVELHLQQRALGAKVLPASDGVPLRPVVLREKRILMESPAPAGRAVKGLGDGTLRLEVERMTTGYEKLSSWRYY